VDTRKGQSGSATVRQTRQMIPVLKLHRDLLGELRRSSPPPHDDVSAPICRELVGRGS